MLHLDQFYILVSQQAVIFWGDAMTVARHLWKAKRSFAMTLSVQRAIEKHKQVHTQVNQEAVIKWMPLVWCERCMHTRSRLSTQNGGPSESFTWIALCMQVAKSHCDVLKLALLHARLASLYPIHLSLFPSLLPSLIYNWLLPLYQLHLLAVNNEWDAQWRHFFLSAGLIPD